MIIGILIGIGIWQLVVMVVCLVSGQDEEKPLIAGMIVPWLLFSGFAIIYKKARLSYYRKNYSLCSLYDAQEEEPYFYFGGIGIKNKDINKYFQEGEYDFFIRITGLGKDFKSIPRETITTIRKNAIRKDGYFDQEWVDDHFKK